MRILNAMAARAIPLVPRSLIRRISRRYIAGETLRDALARVQALHAAGFRTTVDVLGESAISSDQAESMTRDYLDLVETLGMANEPAELSIKLTALGLHLDEDACMARVAAILRSAAEHGLGACIDMEDIGCTRKTLDAFAKLEADEYAIGIALQAYLTRTHDDIVPLLARKSRMRICKGIYAEADEHLVDGASRDRAAINAHFARHVSSAIQAGSFVGIATHDAQLIDMLTTWLKRERIDRSRFEFQMLLGVCEPARDALLAEGFNVRVYVPYGRDWYGYSIRRIKENPRIAGYVLRAAIRNDRAR
ncbi:L-proline dehydrogenase [Burkholderia sp. MSh2]|uniref:proline dehydrogenase n=1 Tax=Burkholderia paludis TaxID=1506587 RepID=A0A6J5E235_9BURK|nr:MULTISPECIES: proline dehydrogenase family protein [Burkholderia]KEZ04241.1 L-proline dehydrogenase [Burkholderia sp. MSh2]KFG97181.1 L-proline dehydrogenase [Burkholderia paludis]CAB3759165.1 Proline dehydrogenase [Burkholderia paludis]VWB53539.1 L-proline dehydrogenase [Burkholderia paludis]